MKRAVVTGAGGFIGHHLVSFLKDRDYLVRGVDIKPPEFEESRADEFEIRDLRVESNAYMAVQGVQEVYHLAADMGGIGYITQNHAELTRNNTLIDTHMIHYAAKARARFFYASSACVYPVRRQSADDARSLREDDVWPFDPEPGYGSEKLFAEQLCEYYRGDLGFEPHVARFHNVYGPLGTFQGGKEKAPAALCRKIALANQGDTIDVWGDGHQRRSFLYVDDCVEGIYRLMQADYRMPINLGSDVSVTINQLVDIISLAAGKFVIPHHVPGAQGVRARNSENSLMKEVLQWEPKTPLVYGLRMTYEWIRDQIGGVVA